MIDVCKEMKDINEKSEKKYIKRNSLCKLILIFEIIFLNFIFNWKNNIYEFKSLCFMIV